MMFKVCIVAAALALASAQTCDETTSFDIIRANEKNVMCGSVVYDPSKYRCCGKSLRREPDNTLSMPSSQDANIGKASDSQFCYGKDHVSSRQMVCGGKIVDAGTWDTMGRPTSEVGCCRGAVYNKEETTYDTDGVTAKKIMGCCDGTATDLVTDASFAATLMCCGATTYTLATEICCANSQTADASVFAIATDPLKTCCGNTYVTADAVKSCCGNTYETSLDSNGNTLKFCCSADGGYLPKWVAAASVMTTTPAPATGSTDAVWTISSRCGCKNDLVALADVEGQDKPLIGNEVVCTGGKGDSAPCSTAAFAFTNASAVGCCSGKHFFTANSDCIGLYNEADSVEFRFNGKAFEETANNGKHLRKNFNKGLFDLEPVNEMFSYKTYNDNSDVISMYCGKSSASTAVASVLAASLAFLAL